MSNPMLVRALLISLYFPPDINGVSTRAYNCARALVLQGCEVTVISAFPNYPNGYHSVKYKNKVTYREKVDGINIIRTWIPNLPHYPVSRRVMIYFAFMLSSLLAFLLVKRAEIIFAMNPSFFAFYPAFVYSVFTRKRIIRNVDDLWPEVFYDMGIVKSSLLKRILDKISTISYRIPKMIVPVSNGYVNTLIDKYNVPQEKIEVIEHGVDILKFKQETASSNHHSNVKKLAIYSGNISEAYDLELVVQAARILTTEPILFIIRGNGPDTEKIKSMIENHGLSNVELKTDILSQQDLVSFLSSADIFLLPMNLSPFGATADKGLPTKTLEYQALGKPIICISNGEAARYISKTKSGLVTSKRDPKEFAALLLQLVNDESLSETLGRNGLNNIVNNLTLEGIGKRFMEVISKAIQ